MQAGLIEPHFCPHDDDQNARIGRVVAIENAQHGHPYLVRLNHNCGSWGHFARLELIHVQDA